MAISPTNTPPRRRRLGCLGSLVLLVVLGSVGYLALEAFTHPWIFTVGGHFRLLPFWQGVGEIQGPGGRYRIFVFFYPENAGSRVLPLTSVRGSGWVCAPSGKSYRVLMGGGTHELIWRDMNNKPFSLYTYRRNPGASLHSPPKLDFTGRWVGPALVMDDQGTTASAFLADGSLNPKPGAPGPARPVTFTEMQWWLSPCDSRGS